MYRPDCRGGETGSADDRHGYRVRRSSGRPARQAVRVNQHETAGQQAQAARNSSTTRRPPSADSSSLSPAPCRSARNRSTPGNGQRGSKASIGSRVQPEAPARRTHRRRPGVVCSRRSTGRAPVAGRRGGSAPPAGRTRRWSGPAACRRGSASGRPDRTGKGRSAPAAGRPARRPRSCAAAPPRCAPFFVPAAGAGSVNRPLPRTRLRHGADDSGCGMSIRMNSLSSGAPLPT